MAENVVCFADWLADTLRGTAGALTMEQALHEVVERLKDLLPHQSLAVLLVDQDTDQLFIKTSREISYSFAKQYRRAIGGLVVPRVLLRHETVVLNNLAPESADYAEVRLEHAASAICLAPIMHSERVVGYLHCDRAEGSFTSAEARLLEVAALLLGLLMEKFELLVLARHLTRVDEASKALKYHAFLDEYRREVARARADAAPLSLLFLDIDDYTAYVQTMGVEAGHALLEKVHNIIRAAVREMDAIGRFSADEFIVCMGGASSEMAMQALEKIRLEVQAGAAASDAPVRATISGVAMTINCAADREVPLEKVLAALGSGLIMARTKGQNQVLRIDPPAP